jgi:hypothetical protein
MQVVVQDVDSNLEQKMGTALRPAHLLFLDEPFGDDLIDRRLGEAGRYALATTIPLAVVHDGVGVSSDDCATRCPRRPCEIAAGDNL